MSLSEYVTMAAKEELREMQQQRQWERVKLVASIAATIEATYTNVDMTGSEALMLPKRCVEEAMEILKAAEEALK